MLRTFIRELKPQISHKQHSTANTNWPWTETAARKCCFQGCKLKPLEGTSYGYAFCEYHLERNAKALGWTKQHFFKKDDHLPAKPAELLSA